MDDEAGDDPAGADVSAASTTSGGFMASTSFEVSVGIRVCSRVRVGAGRVSDGVVTDGVVTDGVVTDGAGVGEGVGWDDCSDIGSDDCLDVGASGRVPGRRMERVRPVRVRPSSVTVIAARTSLGGSEGSTSLSLGSLPRLGGT